VENFWKKMWKKIGVEKTWINDLEEVKSVKKCQCGKKRDKFPWKNITYLVVHLDLQTNESRVHLPTVDQEKTLL
jgi:hypothetical protein